VVSLHVNISQWIQLTDRRYRHSRVLEGTVAANLSATPTAIDYHLIVGRLVGEIFRHVLIIVGIVSTIKLTSFPPLADDPRQLDGHSTGG